MEAHSPGITDNQASRKWCQLKLGKIADAMKHSVLKCHNVLKFGM